MASLVTLAAVQPAAVNGLAASSFSGSKLFFKPSHQSFRSMNFSVTTHYKSGAVVAKYGDKSVYFDLVDLGNTTGQWDFMVQMHLHPTTLFRANFLRHLLLHSQRELLLKFLLLGGGSTLAYLSTTASDDILPIKKGPQLPPKPGPRGKI